LGEEVVYASTGIPFLKQCKESRCVLKYISSNKFFELQDRQVWGMEPSGWWREVYTRSRIV